MNARRPRRARRSRGFTLLEVLVAVAILGTAVVTLLGLHARNLSLAAEAADRTVAATLASDVMSLARIDTALVEGSTKGSFTADRRDSDDASRIYGGPLSDRFVWTRDVTPTALPNLLQIRVRVALAGRRDALAELWAAARRKLGS